MRGSKFSFKGIFLKKKTAKQGQVSNKLAFLKCNLFFLLDSLDKESSQASSSHLSSSILPTHLTGEHFLIKKIKLCNICKNYLPYQYFHYFFICLHLLMGIFHQTSAFISFGLFSDLSIPHAPLPSQTKRSKKKSKRGLPPTEDSDHGEAKRSSGLPREPGMPKRPHNAFFYYSQEKRPRYVI
jgi:hypothetical protein